MKKIIGFYFILFVIVLSASCQKDWDAILDSSSEIILSLEDNSIDMESTTKATALTSLPSSLYWGMTYTNGTAKQSTTSKTVSSSKISTGYYQTASATTYRHYVANANFTAGGNMTVGNNSTDIVAGRAESNSATPSVTLNHIFARTGSFTCNTQSGYNISNVSWTITSYGSVTGTAGTYNMESQSWTARSASLSETAVSGSSDYYLIPGEYTIKVSYTLSLGDYSQSFTKSGRVSLVQGKVNNISCTAYGGSAQSIVISVSLSSWGSQNLTLSI